ncbi:hypothetical protein ACP70R_028697 [Stipagrostis hirtigluma subsp. patula]
MAVLSGRLGALAWLAVALWLAAITGCLCRDLPSSGTAMAPGILPTPVFPAPPPATPRVSSSGIPSILSLLSLLPSSAAGLPA